MTDLKRRRFCVPLLTIILRRKNTGYILYYFVSCVKQVAMFIKEAFNALLISVNGKFLSKKRGTPLR